MMRVQKQLETSHRQNTIMVVDDNSANLQYLADILMDEGYQVLAFPGGRLAIQAAELSPPDLILLDINMPELNGYEVCTLLKAHPELKDIPIIFISALTDTSEKVRAFSCGGVDYISKPFEVEEIKARIKIHLSLAKTELLENEIKKRLDTERRYYAQLDSLADAIIHTTLDGQIVYCNPVVEQYFGYTRQELIGHDIEILIPQEHHHNHLQHRRLYVQRPTTGQMSSVKNIFAQKKSGETFPVDISLSSLFTENELLVSAEIRDISEQYKLKRALEIQQQQFDDAFSKTPDGIILTDMDGCIQLTNPSAAVMLGYSMDELAGQHIALIFDDHEYEKIATLHKSPGFDHQEKSISLYYRRKDGSTLPAEMSIVPVKDRAGEQKSYFTIIRDISERLKMEQKHKYLLKQLMQAQKMESLGQLTGGVAHDFNNILASMMGFTELSMDLLEEEKASIPAEISAKLTDYFNEIHTAGRRAKLLIEQMLTFSRTGANGTLQPYDLDLLVKDAIKMLRPVLPASIRINAYVHDCAIEILANPVQVHQVLMNICINARDAMDGKGRIDITLDEVSIGGETCASCQQIITADYYDLSVRDTGPGIEARLQERLFEPFFTTKTVGKGTGMGLAMVHGIVHHHQGHIILDSKPGQGTTFHILFPRHELKTTTATTQQEIEKEPV